jgi:hypothetical protein
MNHFPDPSLLLPKQRPWIRSYFDLSSELILSK